jgi:hypothetical protein
MSNQTLNPILSFPDVVYARKPRMLFDSRLVALLAKRLKELRIVWSPGAFRGGLNNPELPRHLLTKLESLILLAEALDWKLSKNMVDEIDNTVEDFETFNPMFRARIKRASEDFKKGKFITLEELEKSLARNK